MTRQEKTKRGLLIIYLTLFFIGFMVLTIMDYLWVGRVDWLMNLGAVCSATMVVAIGAEISRFFYNESKK